MLHFFQKYYPIRNIFFVIGDGVLIYLSVFTAALISITSAELHWGLWFYAKLFLITGLCQTCLYYNELYDFNPAGNLKTLSFRLIQALGVASIILGCIFVIFPETTIDPTIFMVGAGILILPISFWRLGYSIVLRRGIFNQPIILLGSGQLNEKIRDEIATRKDCGYTVAVEVPEPAADQDSEPLPASRAAVCYPFDQLCELSRSHKIKKIVVSFREKRCILPTPELLYCRMEGVDIIEGNSFYEMLTGKLLVEFVNPGWLIFSGGFQKSWMRRFVKRSIDLVLSTVLLVGLAPFLLLVMVVIRLDSPGPVIFSQRRVGERHRIYRMHKFRSMVKDAESLSGPVWAEENDPRVTRVGKVMRRLRIDEFAQLWDVFKGEMSFVGPRPERKLFVEELEKIIPYYRERFYVKPGITGWAQINYGYGASIQDAVEKLNYDLFYIKNMTNLMDLLIVLRTIKFLLSGHGVR